MIETCDRCGVPLMVSSGLRWESSGVISLADSPRNRMVFYECENIDHLFQGIEELIGLPIEHIVIESRRRETRRYIERAFPREMRENLDFGRLEARGEDAMTPEERDGLMEVMRMVTRNIIDISRVYGYGDQSMGGEWEGGSDYPWRTQLIRNPYSLTFIAADNQGSVEAFEQEEMRVRCESTAENTYRIEVYPGRHLLELKGRLKRRRYEFKSGDIGYERCSGCGIPVEVAAYSWNLDEGTISDADEGRRMAIFGPLAVDAIFDDLESELGEALPEAIIEAQRRYVRSTWGVEGWRETAPDFRKIIALRGMGDLTRFDVGSGYLSVTIRNSCMHLGMVGTVKALFEMVFGVEESVLEWDLADDGDLNVTVRSG